MTPLELGLASPEAPAAPDGKDEVHDRIEREVAGLSEAEAEAMLRAELQGLTDEDDR